MCLVSVCRSCGRTKNKEFVYCPWCGISSVDGKASEKKVGIDCKNATSMETDPTCARINSIEDTLAKLERELTYMLAVHKVEQR